MVSYFRTPEMQNGRGFRCPNCGKLLAVMLRGSLVVEFSCGRCKAHITCQMKEPVEWGQPVAEEAAPHS